MSPISRRWRNVSLWLGLTALVSPVGFNCHSRTDQSPAVTQASAPVDGADQTVHAMAITQADGAPEGESKVRLAAGSATSNVLTAKQAAQSGHLLKLTSADDAVVVSGTSLMALYDNECRMKLQGHGRSPAGLKFEAEEMKPLSDVALSTLTAQAEADPCLIRLDENKHLQLVAPVTAVEASAFQADAQITAQATVNDPRVEEARHIAFSKALESWDWFFSGTGINTDVIVAVVDTGVLYSHPDLIDNAYTNAAGKHGYDFVNSDDDPLDDRGHGTHCAGIIGARANNAIGIAGVMGTRVKIMGVKVLDNQGSGSEADIVNGIRYAADQGANVINLSLGGKFVSPTIRDAMVYAVGRGVVIAIAAGNDGALMDATTNFYAPSGYAKDIPGTIAVGSLDTVNGTRSSFSNYSTDYVFIGAPGSTSGTAGVLSTYVGNGYQLLQGTSMASPVVAGAAALLIGAFKSHGIAYQPADVVNLLTDSARTNSTLTTFFRSGATLDVQRAAQLFYSRYVMAGNGGTEIQ